MAEYILKDKLNKENITDILVESRALSGEEENNPMYKKAQNILITKGIPFSNHYSHALKKSDLENFDIFICMEEYQINRVKFILGTNARVIKLLDKDIEDPWYTNNFDKVFEEISLGCNKIMGLIKQTK